MRFQLSRRIIFQMILFNLLIFFFLLGLISSKPAQAYSTLATLPPTVHGYWTLDEVNGDRQDSSVEGNHLAELNSVDSAGGQLNQAADFERDNSEYLSIADSNQSGLNPSGDLTLVGWVQIESINPSLYSMFASKYRWGSPNSSRAYRFGITTSGQLHFAVSPDGSYSYGNNVLEGTTTLQTGGVWHHVAAVFDSQAQEMRLYLDGALEASRMVTFGQINLSDAPFMLGANEQSTTGGTVVTQYFDGRLDEWYVYADNLSPAEIQALMDLTEDPITGLTVTNDSPSAAGTVTTLTASITGGENVGYLWDFGDGSPLESGGAIISHTYDQIGSFTAMVFASNSVSTASAMTTVTIQEAPPVAAFTTTTPDEVGEATSFTNTSSGGNLVYEWDFGDGSPLSNLENPSHSYSQAGLYLVELTVSNGAGSDTATGQVEVTEPLLFPPGVQGYWALDEVAGGRQDGSPAGNHLTEVNTVSSTGGQLNLAADFEADNSEYLTISEATQSGLDITGDLTLAGWINQETSGQYAMMASKYDFATGNRSYRFGVSSNALYFLVSPDGTFNSSRDVLVGTSSLGTGNWHHVAAVYDATAQTMQVYLDGVLNNSRSVEFSSIFDSNAPFVLGGNMYGGTVMQPFDGQLDEWYVFAASLSQSEIQDLMDLTEDPIIGLTATNDGPTPLSQATTLTALIAGGDNVSYVWDYGDGSLPEPGGAVVTHSYGQVGSYTAIVTASNSVSTAGATTMVTIEEVPPLASFTSSSPDEIGQVTSFTNSSSGSNLSYEWDFGDGSPMSTLPNPTHTYSLTGTYTVTLTASNIVGLATASDQVVVTAPPSPITGLTATNDSPTPLGEATNLTAAITGGENVSYLWDFGDGSPLDSNGAQVNHTYTQIGTFTAVVFASNSVSTDSATTTVTIEEVPPLAGFTSTTPDELGQVTSFVNSSSGSNLSYEWDFGDGNGSTVANPSHTYGQTGNYTVVMTVTNILGSDSISVQVEILSPSSQPNLRAHWRLNESSGPRLDYSGQDNHLTDNNGVGVIAGPIGSAANLDIHNHEYLSISDAAHTGLDVSSSLTVVGWMNTNHPWMMQSLISKYDLDNDDRSFSFDYRAENRLVFVVSPDGLYDLSYEIQGISPVAFEAGQWYHVAAVFDANQRTLSIYLDGDLLATQSVSYNSIHNSATPVMLGNDRYYPIAGRYFDGALDDWRVYSQALTESEIEGLGALAPTPLPTITPPPPTPDPVRGPVACNPTGGTGGFSPGRYLTTVAGLNAVVVVGQGYTPQTPTKLGFFLHGDGGIYTYFMDPSNATTQFIDQQGWVLVSLQAPNGYNWWDEDEWVGDHNEAMVAALEEMFANYNICRDAVFGSGISGGSEFWSSRFFPSER